METEGLVSAIILDGKGGGRFGGWDEVRRWSSDEGILRLHLDYMSEATQQWLREESGLDLLTIEALTAEETRPRCFPHGDGMLVILRGVNLNPGADPHDMVSARAWIEPARIIAVRHRRVMAMENVHQTREQVIALACNICQKCVQDPASSSPPAMGVRVITLPHFLKALIFSILKLRCLLSLFQPKSSQQKYLLASNPISTFPLLGCSGGTISTTFFSPLEHRRGKTRPKD